MKRLIVNADDLGYSPGTNAGILRAHRDGIVTSASLMTNAPASGGAAEIGRATGSLAIGVHLVYTFGGPLSAADDVPSLVDENGRFLRPSTIVGTGRVRAADALREARAQYARATSLLGREPSHLDVHHWAEEDAAIREALISLASETGAAIRAITPRIRDLAREAGVRTTDSYRRDFQHSGHIDVGSLVGILSSLADGVTELGCHPGDADPQLEAISSYALERPIELATLVDPAVRAKVDELGIRLVTFADL